MPTTLSTSLSWKAILNQGELEKTMRKKTETVLVTKEASYTAVTERLISMWRTHFFPPSFLCTTVPQACSPPAPAEHHCQLLCFEVWTDDALTCLLTTLLALSTQKSLGGCFFFFSFVPHRRVLLELLLTINPLRTLKNYSPEAELQTSWTTNRETFWAFWKIMPSGNLLVPPTLEPNTKLIFAHFPYQAIIPEQEKFYPLE